jgi:sugar lactone lactonase YvrE
MRPLQQRGNPGARHAAVDDPATGPPDRPLLPESARWHEGRFWFADWGTNEVIAVDGDGKRQSMVHVPTARPETRLPQFGGAGLGPISIDWLRDGRLLIVVGRDRLLLRQEPDGSLVSHADLSLIADGAWNEIVVDGRGNAYINGGGSDFVAGENPRPGLVALVQPDGTSRQVADGIALPNGMAVTADGSTLIVADSWGKELIGLDIGPNGDLSNRRVSADLGDGVPDGICADAEDAIWYADVPNQHCVRVRAGGELLQVVELDRGAFSCALGGEFGNTLFIVATQWGGFENVADLAGTGQVLALEVPVPGSGWP